MTTDVRVNNLATITPEALETYSNCMTLIANAYRWASDPNNYDIDDKNAEEKWHKNKALVQEMELSFLRNLAHLVFVSQAHDGEIIISRDGAYSLYWRHPKSGYHGGLIYHPSYKDNECQAYGTWSIHT